MFQTWLQYTPGGEGCHFPASGKAWYLGRMNLSKTAFQATLELLDQCTDEQIVAWGKAFDWTLPITTRREEGGRAKASNHSAGAMLVRHGNERLWSLLVRPGLFDGSSGPSTGPTATSLEGTPSAAECWRRMWLEGIRMGNVRLVEQISTASKADLSPNLPSTFLVDVADALAGTPTRRLGALCKHLMDAHGLCLGSQPGKVADDVRRGVFRSIADNSTKVSVVSSLLDAMDCAPPPISLADALCTSFAHKHLDKAVAIIEHARKHGGFHGQLPSGVIPTSTSNWGQDHEYALPLDMLAKAVGQESTPQATFLRVANYLLDAPDEPAVRRPSSEVLGRALATHCKRWDEALLEKVRKTMPQPCANELAQLMLHGDNEHFQIRAMDYSNGFVDANTSEAMIRDVFIHLGKYFMTLDKGRTKVEEFDHLWKRGGWWVNQLHAEARKRLHASMRTLPNDYLPNTPADQCPLTHRAHSVYEEALLSWSTPKAPTQRARLRL